MSLNRVRRKLVPVRGWAVPTPRHQQIHNELTIVHVAALVREVEFHARVLEAMELVILDLERKIGDTRRCIGPRNK